MLSILELAFKAEEEIGRTLPNGVASCGREGEQNY